MKTAFIILIVMAIMFAFFLGYGLNAGNGNQMTSSATMHNYDNNALQPDFGKGSGMSIVTITGLD